MIYPELYYSDNEPPFIQIIDTKTTDEENPIMEMGGTDGDGDTEELFMTILQAFLDQYADGYKNGFDDANYENKGDK